MSKICSSSGWLIEQLKIELATFDDNTYPLPTYQRKNFESYEQLLREDATALASKSSQYRSRHARVRALLTDVFQGLGPDVFVLCTLAATITKLGAVGQRGLIPELRRWWQTASHPRGLTAVANELCEDYSIQSLISQSQKRGISEVSAVAEPPNRYHNYQNVVEAIDEETASPPNAGQPKKRKRAEAEPENIEQLPAMQTEGTEIRQLQMAQTKELASGDKQTGRQIQYMFSKAPTSHIPLLGDLLSNAVQTSNQWEIERKLGEPTTECLTALIPAGENEDISITLWVGQTEGLQLLDTFKLQRTWSALPNHLSL